MKQRSVLLCIILLSSFFFPLAGETPSPLLQSKTEYFDIIYSESSSETASLLVEYADGLADELCSLLETSMKGRIPVYINPDVQILNAYFSPFPYNHIVLYDTAPVDGSLGGFRETILKVFYHELTHAVSLNIRTPFWQVMSEIFGDAVSINQAVTMPKSFIEGVTVSFESRDGGGRLNDPLTRHFFVQDKLEGKFLSWKDAAGSRDVYPGATASYLYGGAFSAYLQETYGMEKYAELWKKGGSFNPFLSFLQTRFKQVYQVRIEDAWESFRVSVPVPENISVNDRSVSGTKPGIYSALASGPDGIVWADKNTGAVWFRSNAGIVLKLFDSDNSLNRLSLSGDGKLLLVSLSVISGTSIRGKVRVFDMGRKRFLDESYDNLRDASFAGDNATVCAVETLSQHTALVLFTRGKNPEKRIMLSAGPRSVYYSLYNPVYAGKGNLACIAANGLDREILFLSILEDTVTKLALPANVHHMRCLQSTITSYGTVLSFGWTDGRSLYRYALLNMETDYLALQDRDYLGGVFSPVPDYGSSQIIYAASFSGQDQLKWLPVENTAAEGALPVSTETLTLDKTGLLPLSIPSSHYYSPLPWFSDGVFVPFPRILPIDTGLKDVAPGFLFITGDPTERYTMTFAPAFSITPFFIDYAGQTKIILPDLSILAELTDHLEPAVSLYKPYRDSSVSVAVNRAYIPGPSWKTLDLTVGGTAHFYAANITEFENPYQATYRASSVSVETDLSFQAVRRRKIPQFPLFAVTETGYSASANGYFGLVFPHPSGTPVLQGNIRLLPPFVPLSVTFSGALSGGILFSPVSAYVPAIQVRDFKAGVTRLIPAFPEYTDTRFEQTAASKVIGSTAELALLTVEIQRGLPVVPLYANRVLSSAGYRSAFFFTEGERPVYVDSVYARASVQASVIIGVLTDVTLAANAEYAYALRARSGRFLYSFAYFIQL